MPVAVGAIDSHRGHGPHIPDPSTHTGRYILETALNRAGLAALTKRLEGRRIAVQRMEETPRATVSPKVPSVPEEINRS